MENETEVTSLLEDLYYPIIYDLDPINLKAKFCLKQFPSRYEPKNEPHITSFKNKYTEEIETGKWRHAVDTWKREKLAAGEEWRAYLNSLPWEDIPLQEKFNTIWHISGLNPQLEQYREDFKVPPRDIWSSSDYRKHENFVVEFHNDMEENDEYELE
jgi:hypothetical protein